MPADRTHAQIGVVAREPAQRFAVEQRGGVGEDEDLVAGQERGMVLGVGLAAALGDAQKFHPAPAELAGDRVGPVG